MNKAIFNALERVFAREIEGGVLQSKAKIYPTLEADGMVEHGTLILGRDRFGVISVKGWSLTHKGRIAYCAACKDLPETQKGDPT